jgi:AraC-like DNA-binding protein
LDNKVYKFNLHTPLTFFKAGQYFADKGWRHKDIINDGDYELFIMLAGSVYIQIGDQKFDLHQYDCLLIPPYIRHFGFQGSPAGTTYYWMHFYSSSSVTTTYSTHSHLNFMEAGIPQLFNIQNFERITILIRQLLDAANQVNVLEFTASYFISSIVVELSNQYLWTIRGHRSTTHSMRFELIRNWIRIHSHEPLTVAVVAEHFNITPAYLTQLFKNNQKTTTIHYINESKVQQAQELLLTTDWSVKQIALELGFNNEKYFFRIFKRIVGITPMLFRNSYSKTYLNNIQVDPPIPKPQHILASHENSNQESNNKH